MSLLKLLTLIASFGPKIPEAIKLINALIALFAPEITAGGELQLVELTAEERVHAEQISLALSAEGTQAAFDVTKLRAFAKWLKEQANSELGKLLISLLTRAATGG